MSDRTRIPLKSIFIQGEAPSICDFVSNTFSVDVCRGLHLEYDSLNGVVYCTAPGKDECIVPITAITVMRKLVKPKKVEKTEEEAA
jgi:hypothetical protein